MIWTILLSAAGLLWTLFTSRSSADLYYQGVTHGGCGVGFIWLGTHLMDKLKMTLIDIAAVALGAWVVVASGKVPVPKSPDPAPNASPRRPLLPWKKDTEAFVECEDGVGPGSTEIECDLPKVYRKANISSKGLGCCVFRSGDHAAHYQGVEVLWGWPEWMKQNGIAGGGYPGKVDELIARIAKDRKLPVPEYVQHTDGDPKFLELALKNGYMPCITYAGMDPRYGPNTGIDHMVNLVYLDSKLACILDNNYIDKYLWMSRDEFLARWKARGGGWAWTLLAPPPPPMLVN